MQHATRVVATRGDGQPLSDRLETRGSSVPVDSVRHTNTRARSREAGTCAYVWVSQGADHPRRRTHGTGRKRAVSGEFRERFFSLMTVGVLSGFSVLSRTVYNLQPKAKRRLPPAHSPAVKQTCIDASVKVIRVSGSQLSNPNKTSDTPEASSVVKSYSFASSDWRHARNTDSPRSDSAAIASIASLVRCIVSGSCSAVKPIRNKVIPTANASSFGDGSIPVAASPIAFASSPVTGGEARSEKDGLL